MEQVRAAATGVVAMVALALGEVAIIAVLVVLGTVVLMAESVNVVVRAGMRQSGSMSCSNR